VSQVNTPHRGSGYQHVGGYHRTSGGTAGGGGSFSCPGGDNVFVIDFFFCFRVVRDDLREAVVVEP